MTRSPAVILIVIQNVLTDGAILFSAPTAEPFDRCGTRGMRVFPGKAEIRGEHLDRMVARRPLYRVKATSK
jgi:hypothetical protein